MKRKILSLLMSFLLITQSASAEVLGGRIRGWSHIIAKGTELYANEFMSDNSDVGRQTEFYAKYTPNSDVLPTVVTGSSIWGLRNIKDAEEYMKKNGMVPLVGINAAFFSFATGVPMGHVIAGGEIKSKDTEEYQAIGFNRDGTAFIAPLKISTKLKFNGQEIEISHINKYNQALTPIVNLYTDSFDDDNHNETPSLSLILGSVDGKLSIGGSLTAVVEEKFVYTGAIKISKGKLILTLNENSNFMLYQTLNALEVGDSVTIESYSESGDERWNYVDSAIGSVGERLIENGTVGSDFSAGAAPRTAVGITESGELMFYVIDGRQKGHSYGADILTLAERMRELGCVDALNLDGGGSTAISGIYPGCGSSEIINSPSNKALRNCSNYLFLKNAKQPTGELGGIYLYPFEQYYLSGYNEQIYAIAADTEFYPTELPEDTYITAEGGESTFDNESRILTVKGDGDVILTAQSGNVSTKTLYHSIETPTDIILRNGNGGEISQIVLSKDETVSFNIEAWYNGVLLKSSPGNFSISVSDNIGDIEGTSITARGYGKGNLTVSAGGFEKNIPVIVTKPAMFLDTIGHWAFDKIMYVYNSGIISGYDQDGGLVFMPSNNITREEFAVMMGRFLEITVRDDGICEKELIDEKLISDWAKPYVYEMVNSGIIAGKANGDDIFFAPKDNLTRCEAITILSRIINQEEESDFVYADEADIPDWAKRAVSIMTAAGFVSGYEDKTVRPNENVKRAEAVTMIYNIMNKTF